MSSQEISPKASNSTALQALSAIGVLAFTGFMVNSWHRTLSEYNLAQQTQTETVVAETIPTEPASVEPQLVASAAPISSATAPEVQEVALTVTEPAPTVTETVGEITDPATLNALNQKLYQQIDQGWQSYPTFTRNLVYRVDVNEKGAIASYDSLNSSAEEYISETPLPKLNPTADSSPEPQAKFLVVLTPTGSLEVSPWAGKE